MPLASSIFLILSLALAVVLGPQMRSWSWGPALVALAAALVCAAIVHVRAKRPLMGPGVMMLGVTTAGWFAWRAWTSPVAELAHADLLLLAGAVGSFLVVRAISIHPRAEAVFLWGLAGLLLASVVMVAFQVGVPDWSQFRQRPGHSPSAFYGHYNEGSNFLIGASFLVLGSALFGAHGRWTKTVWLLIAIAGLVAVYFTRSRGAILGVAVATAALGVIALVVGSKIKSRWFPAALITFPILTLGAVIALFFLWEKTQEFRSDGRYGVTQMMDNTSRLRNYSLAFETTMQHPLTGGGSRSYSWESNHAWDPAVHGHAENLPEQTHIEILQAATDYGLLGAAGILALLAWLTLRGIWLAKFDESESRQNPPMTSADAMRVGGLAALAGMFTQSCFSFVFHLLPGAMLLGIAMGRLGTPVLAQASGGNPLRFATAAIIGLLAAALVWPAITGTRVYQALAPLYLKIGPAPGAEERIERFGRAIESWPQSELHVARARIHHTLAIREGSVVDESRLDLALANYLAAASLHPKLASHPVNAANLLSLTGDDVAAEALFDKAERLQGNMEPAFQVHFHRSNHHRRKAARLFAEGDAPASLLSMELAVANTEAAIKKSAWVTNDIRQNRARVYESLGLAREANGDLEGAMEAYRFIGGQPFGRHVHYRMGAILLRQANSEWYARQPEAAFPLFTQARANLLHSRRHLPEGVTEAEFNDQIATIDEALKLLRTAGFGE